MKAKLFILALSCLFTIGLTAQEPESNENASNFSLSVDLTTNYVWRGLLYSDAPNLQPALDFTTTNGLFSFGAFGSYSLSNYYSEVDLYASLNLGMFSFAVWDYFPMSDAYNNRFFDFKNESTTHALEGVITFNGPESFPIGITAGTFFYGNDKEYFADLDSVGDNYYSTYFELAYPFKWKSNNLTVFVGATPAEGLYGSEFAVNNIGITNEREIRINDKFSIPIKGSVIINPHLENIFFVLSITLAAND